MYYHINRNSHTHHLRMSDVATSAQNSRIFYLQRSTVGEPGHQFFGAKIGFLQNKKKYFLSRSSWQQQQSVANGRWSVVGADFCCQEHRSSLISVPRTLLMRQKPVLLLLPYCRTTRFDSVRKDKACFDCTPSLFAAAVASCPRATEVCPHHSLSISSHRMLVDRSNLWCNMYHPPCTRPPPNR